MYMTDMRSGMAVAHGIVATLSGTTPAVGNIVDLADFSAATFQFITGAVTDAGTSGGFTVEVQESATTAGADFTAVADTNLVGLESGLQVTVDTQDGVPIGSVGYIGTARYVRVVVTGTTGTDAVVAGTWALQGARYSPKGNALALIAAT